MACISASRSRRRLLHLVRVGGVFGDLVQQHGELHPELFERHRDLPVPAPAARARIARPAGCGMDLSQAADCHGPSPGKGDATCPSRPVFCGRLDRRRQRDRPRGGDLRPARGAPRAPRARHRAAAAGLALRGGVERRLGGRASARGRARRRSRAAAVEARLAPASLSFSVESQYIDRGTVATLAARFARYADLTLLSPQRPGYEAMQSWVMNGALFEFGPAGPAAAQGADGLSGGEAGDHRLGRERRGVEGGAGVDRADAGGRARCTRC